MYNRLKIAPSQREKQNKKLNKIRNLRKNQRLGEMIVLSIGH